MENNPARLREISDEVRCRALKMIHRAGVGHPGGDLSAADILVTLYFAVLNVDPQHPDDPDRDRFILSKGHCSGSLYATLARAGFFPVEELDTYMQPLSHLNGHPSCSGLPGVEASTGPLGHGLPVAVGAAVGAKLDHASWRTFVLTGDGELQEGSNWEALMAAAHYGLDNLIAIIDRNRLQITGATEHVMGLEPLADRLRAFGWEVREVDGHLHSALLAAFEQLPFVAGHPSCIIAHTHKGYGVSFMQDRFEWHHRVPTEEELEAALLELAKRAV